MSYTPNLTWTVADVDRLQELARRHLTADEIARDMRRASSDVRRFCDHNGIFVRTISSRPTLHGARVPEDA